MVFAGVYPVVADQYEDLRASLEKLQLNDASLTFEPEARWRSASASAADSSDCCTWRSSRSVSTASSTWTSSPPCPTSRTASPPPRARSWRYTTPRDCPKSRKWPDRGTLYLGADHHQSRLSGQCHQALHRQARRTEKPDLHHHRPRGDQFRHAAVGDRLRLLRQAQIDFEGLRLVRLPPHGLSTLEAGQAGHPAQRRAGRRALVAHLRRPRLRLRPQDVRKAQGADPAPAVRHRHSGGYRRQDHRPRNGEGRAQGRDGQVLRRRHLAQTQAARKTEGGQEADAADRTGAGAADRPSSPC